MFGHFERVDRRRKAVETLSWSGSGGWGCGFYGRVGGGVAMADERKADILAPGWVVTPGLSLADARDLFLAECQSRLSPKTIHFYRWGCASFIAWSHDQHAVDDLSGVSTRFLREYIVNLRTQGLKPASVRAAVRIVRSWFLFLEAEELLPGKNPMGRVKLPKLSKHLLPAISLADVRSLLEAAKQTPTPERDTAIIFMLVDSGVRASELCGLVWRDVDLQRGQVFVRSGKGDKDRFTFLGKRSREALATYRATLGRIDPGSAVFQRAGRRYAGGGLRYDGLKRLLRRLGDAAGVPGCHAHAFRRSFAVEMRRDGADLVCLARLMGHSDLTMLQQHYIPLLTDDLANAHREH
jgi:site-specific recombinase XerD